MVLVNILYIVGNIPKCLRALVNVKRDVKLTILLLRVFNNKFRITASNNNYIFAKTESNCLVDFKNSGIVLALMTYCTIFVLYGLANLEPYIYLFT
jgi:hypothetical protein